MPNHYNVLFLCTGNSARSIMAEAILNHKGKGQFHRLQRGQPSLRHSPRPRRSSSLNSPDIPTAGLRSKSWDEFAAPGAPQMDFVFTVCDNAANEQCPYWPGQPMTAHWGIPDPAAVQGHARRDRTAPSAMRSSMLDRASASSSALPLAHARPARHHRNENST